MAFDLAYFLRGLCATIVIIVHEIILFMNRISREEKSNKMGLKNLSVVFGPTLFRPPSRGGGTASTDQLFFMAAFETVTQVRLLQQILILFSTLT